MAPGCAVDRSASCGRWSTGEVAWAEGKRAVLSRRIRKPAWTGMDRRPAFRYRIHRFSMPGKEEEEYGQEERLVVEWARASRRWRPVFDPLTLALSRWERGRSFWACRRGASRVGYFESRLTVRWRGHRTLLRSWVEKGCHFGHAGERRPGLDILGRGMGWAHVGGSLLLIPSPWPSPGGRGDGHFGHIGEQGFGLGILSRRWWCDGEVIAPYVAPFGNF